MLRVLSAGILVETLVDVLASETVAGEADIADAGQVAIVDSTPRMRIARDGLKVVAP